MRFNSPSRSDLTECLELFQPCAAILSASPKPDRGIVLLKCCPVGRFACVWWDGVTVRIPPQLHSVASVAFRKVPRDSPPIEMQESDSKEETVAPVSTGRVAWKVQWSLAPEGLNASRAGI